MKHLGLLGLLVGLGAGLSGDDFPLEHRLVDSKAAPFPQFLALGDLDGDGFDDLVLGSQDGALVWYRYPSWTKAPIAPAGSVPPEASLALVDMDGDGDLDVVVGELGWFENPRPAGDPAKAPWTFHKIGRATACDLVAADLDGDGKPELVTRGRGEEGRVIRVFSRSPEGSWTAREIACPPGEGLALGDLNRDGRPDLVIAGRWYETPKDLLHDPWIEHVYAEAPARADLATGDLNGDGRVDIVVSSREGKGRLSWFEAPLDPVPTPWTEHVMDPAPGKGSALALVDLDGDGRLDVMVSRPGEAGHVAAYFNLDRGERWRLQPIAEGGRAVLGVACLGKNLPWALVSAVPGREWGEVDYWEHRPRVEARIQAHLFISGRVQGVGFRASTEEAAKLRGVQGWVRNLSDGRVEAVIQGPHRKVVDLAQWCEHGPSTAQVTRVEATYGAPVDRLSDFTIR